MIAKTFLRTLFVICFYLLAVQTGLSQVFIDEDSAYYAQKQGQTQFAANKPGNAVSPPAAVNNGFINRAFDASGKNNTASTSLTSCYFPPDNTYLNFPGNDDGSIGPIALPFPFNLFGTNYNQIFINNNGNITFLSATSVFSASGFPFNVPMVAPFWADVDTRTGATVKYKVNPTNVIVTWPGVGYYNLHTNLLNTFQLIISNGNDPLIGIGNNVAFYYDDMQWTTGDASSGSGGFGGTPATVGINKGDNVNYIQIGRFNLNNSNYDGPLGANDGVHHLDDQCYFFNVGNFGNLPPTVSGNPPNNTITIACGQTGVINLQALPPEVGQSVSAVVNTGGLCNTTVSTTSGATANATVTIMGAACNQGTNIISFIFTDNFNPPASTTVNITVNVTSCCVPTTITCPQNITVNNTSGQCGANVNFAATATGTSPTITYSHQPGSFFPVGTTTVTATASNSCSSNSCTFTITVNDNQAPTISCPGDITVTATQGQCGARVCYPTPVASDNCRPATPLGYFFLTQFGNSYYYRSNGGANYFTHESNARAAGGHLAVITSSAENAAISATGTTFSFFGGNDAEVEGSFKWITCENYGYSNFCGPEPNGGTVENYLELVGGGCWNDLPAGVNRFSILEIEGASIVQTSGLPQNAFFPVGTTTNTFVATDAAGNTATCSFTVTVVDNEAPSITCAGPVTINNTPGLCTGTTTLIAPTVSDNCSSFIDGPEMVTNGGFSSGATSWNACGNAVEAFCSELCYGGSNASNLVAEVDHQPVTLCQNISGFIIGRTYRLSFLASRRSGGTPPTVGAIVTINGGALNTTVNRTNTVFNLTPETFTFVATQTTHQLTMVPTAGWGGTLGFIVDNISIKQMNGTVTNNAPSVYPVGNTTVTWTATDASGNSATCTQTVTVVDNQPPVITCPADINANTDPGICGASIPEPEPHATDNCGVESIVGVRSDSRPLTDIYPVGTTTIEWTATDIHGNTASCTQTVVVTDNEDPVITCPGNISVNNTPGQCGADVNFAATATDNCSATITYSHAPGSFFPVGTTTVTATATDPSGNDASCTFTVTVTDNEPPVIHLGPVLSCYADNNNGCSIDLGVTATDNCGAVSLTSDAPVCFPVGTTTVTWTAMDIHGNVTIQTQQVTRNPEINISICASPTRTIYTGVGPQSVSLTSTVTGGTPGYMYSWSPSAGLNSTTTANPTASPTVTTTYTLTVTDSRGCTRSLSITINVLPMSAAVCGGNGNNLKFNVCHIPPGNPSNAHNICISSNALNAHLVGGSNGHNNCYLGPCGQQLCFSTVPGATTFAQVKEATVETIVTPVIVEEPKDAFKVNAYPNPSAGEFSLQVISRSTEPIRVRIMDMNGVVKSVSNVLSKTNTIQVGANMPAGTYMAEVTQGQNKQVIKLVKLN